MFFKKKADAPGKTQENRLPPTPRGGQSLFAPLLNPPPSHLAFDSPAFHTDFSMQPQGSAIPLDTPTPPPQQWEPSLPEATPPAPPVDQPFAEPVFSEVIQETAQTSWDPTKPFVETPQESFEPWNASDPTPAEPVASTSFETDLPPLPPELYQPEGHQPADAATEWNTFQVEPEPSTSFESFEAYSPEPATEFSSWDAPTNPEPIFPEAEPIEPAASASWESPPAADSLPSMDDPALFLDTVNQQLYPSDPFLDPATAVEGAQAFEEAAQFLFPETASASPDWQADEPFVSFDASGISDAELLAGPPVELGPSYQQEPGSLNDLSALTIDNEAEGGFFVSPEEAASEFETSPSLDPSPPDFGLPELPKTTVQDTILSDPALRAALEMGDEGPEISMSDNLSAALEDAYAFTSGQDAEQWIPADTDTPLEPVDEEGHFSTIEPEQTNWLNEASLGGMADDFSISESLAWTSDDVSLTTPTEDFLAPSTTLQAGDTWTEGEFGLMDDYPEHLSPPSENAWPDETTFNAPAEEIAPLSSASENQPTPSAENSLEAFLSDDADFYASSFTLTEQGDVIPAYELPPITSDPPIEPAAASQSTTGMDSILENPALSEAWPQAETSFEADVPTTPRDSAVNAPEVEFAPSPEATSSIESDFTQATFTDVTSFDAEPTFETAVAFQNEAAIAPPNEQDMGASEAATQAETFDFGPSAEEPAPADFVAESTSFETVTPVAEANPAASFEQSIPAATENPLESQAALNDSEALWYSAPPVEEATPAVEGPAPAPTLSMEHLEILGTCPLTQDKRLLLVQSGQQFALMGQAGFENPSVYVLKIFDGNPVAYQQTFAAAQEGQAGEQGMFVVQVGTWHAIVSTFRDQIVLHTELG